MLSSCIFIFGGKPGISHQIIPFLPTESTVRFFAIDYQLKPPDLYPKPLMLLIIAGRDFIPALLTLQLLRQKLPDTPLFFLAENPKKEDIIDAYQNGVDHFFLLPLETEKFTSVVFAHLRRKKQSVLVPSLKGWFSRLHKWFQFGKKDTLRPPPPLLQANSLGRQPIRSTLLPKVASGASSDLSVFFFGKLTIRLKGKELPNLPGEKINALFAYLLYHHQKPLHREVLMTKFWGNTSPSSARNSLNVAIHNLRRHINDYFPGNDILQYNNDNYLINTELEVMTDKDLFLYYWRKGLSLESKEGITKALPAFQKAAALYRGDFLEDFFYEEWCEIERDNLKETYLLLLDRLGTHYMLEGEYAIAVEYFKKMLAKDACLEDVHRKMIFCYYQSGLRDLAIKQFYKCALSLQKELKIEPSQQTQELFRLINAERPIIDLLQ